MWSRLLTVLVAALALTGAVTATAVAQDQPGVTVDPGSPSGKEYALPVQAARSGGDPGGSGSTSKGGGTSGNAPLFGVGVGDDRAQAAAGTSSSGPSEPRTTRTHARTTGASTTTTPTETVKAKDDVSAVTLGAGDGGDDGSGTLLLVVGAVLAAGLLLGLLLRRQGRTAPR